MMLEQQERNEPPAQNKRVLVRVPGSPLDRGVGIRNMLYRTV